VSFVVSGKVRGFALATAKRIQHRHWPGPFLTDVSVAAPVTPSANWFLTGNIVSPPTGLPQAPSRT
jgi:hypothetical protein